MAEDERDERDKAADEAPEEATAGEPADEAPAEPTAAEPADEAPAEPTAEEPADEAPAEPTAEEPADEAPAEPTAEEPADEAPAEPTAEESAAEAPAEPTPAEAPGGGEVAASGAAGEPSEGASEPPTADAPLAEPPADGGEVAASGAAGEPSEGAAEAPAEQAAAPPERPRRPREGAEPKREEVVPGAHLEPDLVLEPDRPEGDDDEYARYREPDAEGDGAPSEAAAAVEEQAAPAPRRTIDLAADARYKATGKRKTAVARVVVRPGSGSYTVNGRSLEQFFPRPTLQRNVRQPLETAGYETRMDVVARLHGGGVSSQADALRHGIARALVEADPNLRTELKRRGFLTRDAREKERKKAGLKKARKRPQFSKR